MMRKMRSMYRARFLVEKDVAKYKLTAGDEATYKFNAGSDRDAAMLALGFGTIDLEGSSLTKLSRMGSGRDVEFGPDSPIYGPDNIIAAGFTKL